MKELGEYLKEIRQSNGVGIEEASEDLKVSQTIIQNIENGNTKAFRDVLELKEIIKNYAKYLGLDPEKVIDEFNDFLFAHTSKISLTDILEAEKKSNEKETSKIYSPYTKCKNVRLNSKYIKLIVAFLSIIVFLIILIIILKSVLTKKETIINKELRGDRYEHAEQVNYY